jgi:hypothetical protein
MEFLGRSFAQKKLKGKYDKKRSQRSLGSGVRDEIFQVKEFDYLPAITIIWTAMYKAID